MDKRQKNSIIITIMIIIGLILSFYTPLGGILVIGAVIFLFFLLIKDITGNGDL